MNFSSLNRNASSSTGGINLDLGKNIALDLTKQAPNLKRVYIGGSWDAPQVKFGQDEYDLDLFVVFLNKYGKLARLQDPARTLLWYRNPQDQGIRFTTGDSLTGSNDDQRTLRQQDDEEIEIDLEDIPRDIDKLAVWIDINEIRGDRVLEQTFGQIKNARITLYDGTGSSKTPIARVNLNETNETDTAVCAGILQRTPHGWEYVADKTGYIANINDVLNKYL